MPRVSGFRSILPGAVLVAAALSGVSEGVDAQEWKAHGVPLFVSASHPSGHQGFVRVVNRSDEAGEVLVDAVDDTGVPYGPVTLRIGAGETVHFNSGDLEEGNPAKGLSGSIGVGDGDWRLRLRSQLDLEVLAYNRTVDGLLAPLHDLVPGAVVRRPSTGDEAMGHRVAIFNPASNVNQVSRLRIVNRGEETAAVAIEGVDDDGETPGMAVELEVPAGASRTVTSQALESGQGEGLAGVLDDGKGKWRLVVTSDEPVEVMSLLTSPTGHLTNLSTVPGVEPGGGATEHQVPLFAAAANANGYQGFVRVINRSGEAGEVSVEAFDDAGMDYGPVTLDIEANETVHFNSGDLEEGNADKGLSEGIGEGTGDWRLRLSSDLDLEVLAYNRTHDGLLTTLHDVAPYTEVVRPGGEKAQGHHVAIFNPASNVNQVSRLRVINPGAEAAAVVIEGIDDAGRSPGEGVRLSVPAGAARTFTSQALESGRWDGGVDASGSLGDGKGKWRLAVTSEQTIEVMSLLSSPTGHLVNLSTAAPGGVVVPPPVVATHAAMEVTGRSIASVGTPVALSVRSVGMSEVAIERYAWVFSDGQRGRGEEVSVRFAEAGVVDVTVSAMSGTDVVAQATWAVAVFDAAAGANPGFEGIPAIFGDVNQDGQFGRDDLELAERAVAGTAVLEPGALDAADLDLSGGLEERDVELTRQALDNDAALPSALLDESAYPGGVVAMVSPAFRDPDADIEIFVDGVASSQVMRAILGYVTFEVPPSLTGEDAVVEVVVEVGGVVAERLRLRLKPLPDKPAMSAKEDVLAFLAELAELAADQEAAGADFLAQNGGLSADDTAIVLGAAKAAAEQLRSVRADLEVLLNGEGGAEFAAFIQSALHANGLAEFRESVRAMPSKAARSSPARGAVDPSVAAVCNEYVPAMCALQDAREVLSLGSKVAAGVCTVAGLASAPALVGSLGGFAPVVAFITKYCVPVAVALELANVLAILVDPITLGVRLSSDTDALSEGKTATITAEVTFIGVKDLCSRAVSNLSGELDGKIVKAITKRLLKRSKRLALVLKIVKKLKLSDLNPLVLTAVERAVAVALTRGGLDSAFEKAFGAVCDYIGVDEAGEERAAGLRADAALFNLEASEDGALLQANDDGTGTYSLGCPVDFTGPLVVTGGKELCGEAKEDELTVTCGNPCPGAAEGEVDIPDAGLRAAIEEWLAKPAGTPITRADMERLHSLRAENREITNLTGLECATRLTFLGLEGNRISDVSPLSGLITLPALDLENNQVSDVSPLTGLTALTSLYLSHNSLSDVSLLSELAALTHLSLSHNQLTDVSPLSRLTNLVHLILGDNQLTDVSALSGMAALALLDIRNNQISHLSLSGLTALEIVWLRDNPISHLSLSGLAALRSLNLYSLGNQVTSISLSGLTALPSLWLRDNQVSHLSLSGLAALARLDFENNQISHLSLSGLTALTRVRLANNQISDVSPLSGLTALTELELGNNQISDVSPLSGLTALMELELGNNRISNVSPLSGLTALMELKLGNNRISNVSPLSGLAALTRLDLEHNRISDIGPLVSNAGLNLGDWLSLGHNPLSVRSCSTHIPALQERGVSVGYGLACD